VAWTNVMAAYAMAIFFVAHVYMATTGETITEHLRAMITGYGWVAIEDAGSRAPHRR